MEIKTKTVKLHEIHPNPDNPRTITGKAMESLVKSLTEFPEMLELREIVVDESMMVLGGNMRLRALEQIGAKVCIARIVTGLTDEQKREFVIKDNAAFGEWDMDALANMWSDLPLDDWGVKIPSDWLAGPDIDEARKTLQERFIVPPFSILDARQGYWRQRKNAWLTLGIQSELGRGGGLLKFSEQATISVGGEGAPPKSYQTLGAIAANEKTIMGWTGKYSQKKGRPING